MFYGGNAETGRLAERGMNGANERNGKATTFLRYTLITPFMRLCRFLLPAVVGAAVSASFGAEFPNPYPAPAPGVRLTPETPLSPSINGARIVGATPGSRMLFQVPVSGERPMKIQAAGLPPGLKMDSRGLIAGTARPGRGNTR